MRERPCYRVRERPCYRVRDPATECEREIETLLQRDRETLLQSQREATTERGSAYLREVSIPDGREVHIMKPRVAEHVHVHVLAAGVQVVLPEETVKGKQV